jgi:hypothetical protein
VEEHGDCGFWALIAEELGSSRTPLQCLQRYQQAFNTKLVNSSEWTKDEDEELKAAAEMFGLKNWQHVSSVMNGRSAAQCMNRYYKSSVCRSDMVVDGSWQDEDERRLFLSAIANEIPSSNIFRKSAEEISALFISDSNVPSTANEAG